MITAFLLLAAVMYGAGLPIALAFAMVLISVGESPTKAFLAAVLWPLAVPYFGVRALLGAL